MMSPETAMGSGTNLRVLIVDDSHDTADSLAILVRIWGHDARPVYGAFDALALAPQYRPHVIFLDLGLPEVDGFRVAQALRQIEGWAPASIIAITGHGDEHFRRRCFSCGMNHFLVKPVDPCDIELLLSQMCRVAIS